LGFPEPKPEESDETTDDGSPQKDALMAMILFPHFPDKLQ